MAAMARQTPQKAAAGNSIETGEQMAAAIPLRTGAVPIDTGNIVLIGMPGVGKSTVGIVLAKMLNLKFIDADLLIQNQCDKTLQKIIDALGPEGFIEIENRILSELDVSRTLVSTGGSAVYSPEAMEHLRTLGPIIYLKVSFTELRSRLQDLQQRGVVMKGGNGIGLRGLYDERVPLYEAYADLTVDVEDLTVAASARKIVESYERYCETL